MSKSGRANKKNSANGRLYVGTSGWSYKDWRGRFYPNDLPTREYLSFYGEHFGSAEVNATFYHLLESNTYREWAQEVPADFRFSLKLSRYVSHIKRLKDCREPFETFLGGAKELKRRMGPILVQLPPNFKIDTDRIAKFLSNTQEARHECGVRKRLRFAFEFRHESWFEESEQRDELLSLLRRHNCAFVHGHSSKYPYPADKPVTADFVYQRFHGPGEMFASEYGTDGLKEFVPDIKQWLSEGKDVYAYFNNDMHGYAIDDARELKALTSAK